MCVLSLSLIGRFYLALLPSLLFLVLFLKFHFVNVCALFVYSLELPVHLCIQYLIGKCMPYGGSCPLPQGPDSLPGGSLLCQ